MHIFTLVLSFFLAIILNSDVGSCAKEGKIELSTVIELKGQGTLEGITLTSRKGRKYLGFLGVPFGKIPQRFSVAEKPNSWKGVKSAKTLPPPCFQFFTFTQQMMGVEDCLHANIYTPNTREHAKLPVIVWIYPGGFQIGGGAMMEGKYFADENAVLVTFNYRLGAFGFLNTEDEIVSGNMGLKDQARMLEWVREHIHQFGGNPNLVTILGMSAGGASVEYLTMSPQTRGLINNAISMSGSVLAPWAFQHEPRKLTEALGEKVGCDQKSSKELVKCLREKDASAILTAQLSLMKLGIDYDFIHMKFSPSIESEKVTRRFLSDTPYNLLKAGKISSKVPWMSGYVENEGSFYIAPMMTREKQIEKINAEWDSVAPYMFYYDDLVSSDKMNSVSKKIRDFYFKSEKLSWENRRSFADIYTDRFFSNSVAKSILLHAPHQEVFPYYNDYQGNYSLIQFDFEGIKDRDGVAHADELMYMFNQTVGGPEITLGTPDGEFSEKLLKLFVSFAKDGKPTSTWGNQKKWEAFKVDVKNPETSSLKYYKLDLENTEIISDKREEMRRFWDELPIKEHEKYGKDDRKDEL